MKFEISESNQNMFCAVNHEKKAIVVAFRGVDLNLADLAHDIGSILPGTKMDELSKYIQEKTRIDHRFNNALSFSNQVEKKHKDY